MQIPQTKQELELLFTFEPNGSDSSDLPEIQVVSEKMKEIHFLLFGNPNISSEILMEYVQSATMILSAYHSTVSTFIRNVFQLNCDDWILEVNVTALLCLPDSDAFNSPIQYYIHEQKIISILVHLSQKIPNSRSMIKNYILELSKKDGISIHRLRDALTSKMMFLELCLQWTCNDILDLPYYLNSIITKSASWVKRDAKYLESETNILNRLMNEMGAAENAGYRCILTRCIFACCYLLGTRCSLEFICNSITKSKVLWSEQLVSLNMCLLCFHIQPGMDVKSNQLFKETMEELLYSTASGFPLTLGLYFIENDIKAAHESINSVLKLQVSLSSERYHYVRHIITEIFSFKKAAEIAFDILKQSKSLKDGADDVSIRLTTHMLSHKAFRDTSIDLQQGICLIFQKLKFDHRLIPLLTKQFCECTFETLSIKRIPSSYILEIFKSDESVDFEKSFLAFYVFLYNSLYSKLNSVLLYDSYGTHVIKSIPIPKLLEFVKVKLPFLFPTMSSLIAVQRPEYFAVENHLIGYSLNHTYLVDKYYLKQDDEIVEDRSFPDYKRLMKILRSDVSKKSLYYTLSVLSKISGEELQQGVEKKSLCLLRDVWYKHYIQSPLETCYETMDKLGNLDTFQLDDLALFENPVIILQSCGRFCGIPELFPIILQIIQFGSANFRYRLAQSKIISPREVETAILTHDALVIHSLFDVLSSKQKSELITTLICKFIHQIFVDRVGCLKVVHFQGYNLDLIPITVSKIPSMHVLTTMVPELLNRPRPQDFIFGFTLFTELCKKYPFDTTLKISKGLLEKLQMIKLEGDIELVCQILIATIPKLLTIASAFPVSMVIPISSYLSDLQMKIPKSNTLSCWGQLETVILKTLANIHNQVLNDNK